MHKSGHKYIIFERAFKSQNNVPNRGLRGLKQAQKGPNFIFGFLKPTGGGRVFQFSHLNYKVLSDPIIKKENKHT